MTTIPGALADEIGWREDMSAWPWLEDRDGETWAVSPYSHGGEAILWPFAGDMQPSVRSSVEATYGPLVDVPHCLVCGSTETGAGGACPRGRDTIAHPVR